MVRFVLFFLAAVVGLGVVLTPGLGLFALVLVPLFVLWLAWRGALTATTRGHSNEAIAHAHHRQFLGPGGPDDPYADEDKEG